MTLESQKPAAADKKKLVPMPVEVINILDEIQGLIRANLQADWRTAPFELLTYRMRRMEELAVEAYKIEERAIEAAYGSPATQDKDAK